MNCNSKSVRSSNVPLKWMKEGIDPHVGLSVAGYSIVLSVDSEFPMSVSFKNEGIGLRVSSMVFSPFKSSNSSLKSQIS